MLDNIKENCKGTGTHTKFYSQNGMSTIQEQLCAQTTFFLVSFGFAKPMSMIQPRFALYLGWKKVIGPEHFKKIPFAKRQVNN